MLECEGYKMFRGEAKITPMNAKIPPFTESGDWLYKPEYGYWYVNGRSYSEKIIDIGNRKEWD